MSIDICKSCDAFVDTDNGDSAYDFDKCLCECCRDEEIERRDPEALALFWDNQDIERVGR